MGSITSAIVVTPALNVSEFGRISNDASPLYVRIASTLGNYIRVKGLAPGTKLSSEHQFAKHFGVSIITMRAALKRLVDNGVIERQQGAGTFVRRSEARTTEWALGSMEDLINTSQLSEVVNVRNGFFPAPNWAATALGSAPNRQAFNIQVIRSQGGRPFLLTDAYYPAEIGDSLSRIDIPLHLKSNHLLIGVVEQITQLKVIEIRQTISATSASKQVAEMLEIRSRSPILLMTRLSYA